MPERWFGRNRRQEAGQHCGGVSGVGMAAEPFGRFPVARTADVDEAQEAMRSTFLPLDLRPLEPVGSGGGLDLGLNATRVGDVTVTYVRFGRGVQIDTAEAENYHVNLPITGGTVSRSGRLEPVASTPQLAAVFMPGLDAELEWQAGTAQFCLMFPRHVLQQELEAMLDRPLAAPLVFAPAMDVTGDAGRAWVDALRLIERQSRYSRGLLDHPLAAGNLQRILVDGLLLAQPHPYTAALAAPHPPAAPPAIHRAIELLHTHPEQPWTTADHFPGAVAVDVLGRTRMSYRSASSVVRRGESSVARPWNGRPVNKSGPHRLRCLPL